MKKMEFSKRLLFLFIIIEAVVIAFAMIMMAITCDLSLISFIISAIAAEVSAGTAFYYWKSKNENRYKYAQMFVQDIANTYGIDMAIRMAEVVLKD